MSDTPKRSASDKATDTRTRAFDSTGPGDPDDARTRTSTSQSAPVTPDVLPRFDGYTVVRKIGEGGMGAVYLAEDVQLGRAVAIKTMRPEVADARNRSRFVREAQTAAAVEHDNIVPILHIGEAGDGTPFIVMPFLKGEMLADRLKREPRSPAHLILKVAHEVAEGLAAAHAKGLIHRDIKPGNVWLEEKGRGARGSGSGETSHPPSALRCKVLDFGLARSTEAGDVNLTATGAILGTPAYMAPEQARGERVDGRADLFSLGVMLYRMAAGQLPFRGDNGMAILIALATETPPPTAAVRPDLPPPLAALVDWLLQKAPADRPQTAAEVAAAVRAIEDGMPVALPAPAPVAPSNPWEEATATEGEHEREDKGEDEHEPGPRAKPARGRWWLVGGALVGLLALAALAVVFALRPSEGTLAVEIAPDAEARFRDVVVFGPDGTERARLTAGERTRRLPAGPYTVRADGQGLTVDPSAFTLRRGERMTVRVALAPPQPVIPVIPVPKKEEPKLDFREIHGASEAELEKWMQKLQEDGYRPSALNADAGPEPRFAAVAVPNAPKIPWTFVPRQETNGPRWQSDWEARWNAGLKPDVCALYSDGGNQYASQVWVTDTRRGGSWTGPRAFIQGKINDLRAPGSWYRPTELAGSPSRFGLQYQVVMGPADGRKWETEFDMTAEQLAAAVATWRKQGWRPDALSGYHDGDRVRFLGLFGEDPTRGASWEFQMGLSAKEYGEKVATRAVRPLIVLGYVPTGTGPTLYAVVWQKAGAKAGAAADPRKAAEWALASGGYVMLEGQESFVRNRGALPDGPIRLSTLNVQKGAPAAADGMAACAGLTDLTHLWLMNTPVTDDGLKHLAGCTRLRQLNLFDTRAGDAGVAPLAGPDLVYLAIGQSQVTAVGLDPFARCERLAYLDLKNIPLTDAGFARFQSRRLHDVRLLGTKVTDATLERLAECPDLRIVFVQNTAVTAAGAAALARARPRCQVWYDGGSAGPLDPTDPDRAAAEAVLARGGAVWINDFTYRVRRAPDLMSGALRLTGFEFGKDPATDDDLTAFKECAWLERIHLRAAKVTDTGMANFAGSRNVTHLNLWETQVTDVGLKHFAECRDLTHVELAGTPIRGTGLRHFRAAVGLKHLHLPFTRITGPALAECKNWPLLEFLDVGGTAVNDAGLAHVKDCTQLRVLHLAGTKVTDAGLIHLMGLSRLTNLDLRDTAVTPAVAASLAKTLPRCRIDAPGGVIEPTQK